MLLKRMKECTQLLQREGNEVNFVDMAGTLRDGMERTSVYLVNRKGKLLAYALEEGFENTSFDQDWLANGVVPDELNDSLLKIGAVAQINGDAGHTMLVSPVVGSGRRVGSLMFVKEEGSFNDEDIIVAEFGSTSIGMVISHAIYGEEEDEAQESKLARSALKSLSYSEILAMQRIFDELEGDEGLLVASRIADDAGITRSVIVNALRKLASAGVIESRSLGMKGTYLRVLNREIRGEFERQRYPYPNQSYDRKQA